MKVLMIAPEPFFTERGTPISVLTRAKALSRLGYEVDILTYHIGRDVRLPRIKIYRIPKVPLIKHIPIGFSYKKIILDFILFLFTLLFSFKEKYEFIHAHEEGAALGVIVRKIFRRPLIYDMHSSIQDHLSSFFGIRYVTYFGSAIQKWIAKNSDVIIVISQSLMKEVSSSIAANKVFLIENIPIFEDFSMSMCTRGEDIRKLKEELNVQNESMILYTGTFESYQGLDILLKAIPIVVGSNRNVRLIMVGGEERQIDQLKKLAKSLKVTEYVIFTGKKPLSEMPIFMKVAHVLVSPRTKERASPPLKLYTYLQSKVPIVATNVPANTQILTNGISVLTEPEPNSFAKGIIRILEDKDLRNRIVENTEKLRFSYSDFLSKLNEAYSYLENRVTRNNS